MNLSKKNNRILLLLFAGVLMGALDISIVGPAIPAIEKTMSLSGTDLSWIFSIYVLFYLFGIPILSKLSDMHGRRMIYIISLVIIGVDYALLWALLAGLMNYIPNVGSVIAIIPTFFFALVQLGIGGALWTFGSFLVIHNVLGNFIEPKLMGKGLDLSALVVILSLIFWGFILGPVGMFLATPFTLTIKIIMEQNEKTRWLAVLLGTPAEAKTHLENKEQNNIQ
jgi:MFS family permease